MKSYCRLNLLRASIFNYERLDILRDSIGHPSKNLLSITSVSIYYGIQSDIRIKSYCHFNLLRASVFNFERLDILRGSIRHPSKKLLSLIFLRASDFYLERLNILLGSIGHLS